MSNKRAQNYKKKTKKKSSQKNTQKRVAVQSGTKTIGDCQTFVNLSIEEIFDRIASCERKGNITHAQAFEVAERYANQKPGEIFVPKEVYNAWSDNGCEDPKIFVYPCN